MARILITGGYGFIGRLLSERLAAENEVLVVDSLHPQVHGFLRPEQAAEHVSPAAFALVDMADAAAVDTVTRYFDPEIVFHLAADTGTGQSRDEVSRYCKVNVVGTANLVESVRRWAKSCRRFIIPSSRAIYGEGAVVSDAGRRGVGVPRRVEDMAAGDFRVRDETGAIATPVATAEDQPPRPASVYASTKLMQEYLLQQCFEPAEVGVTALRLQNVYGPGQSQRNPYTGVLSVFRRLIQEGRDLPIYEDGDIVRDFVFVDDVVSALAAAAARPPRAFEAINIGSGEGVSLLHVARTMLSIAGRPETALNITGQFRPGDVRHAKADIGKAQRELGWRPEVDLRTGLSRLLGV
jgi:dTDP-L-rhamnose 4-epimerase